MKFATEIVKQPFRSDGGCPQIHELLASSIEITRVRESLKAGFHQPAWMALKNLERLQSRVTVMS